MRPRLLLGLAVFACGHVALALDFREIKSSAQDATGLVWMVADVQISGTDVWNALVSTNGSVERQVMCPGGKANPRAQQLLRRRDGSVLCAWWDDGERPAYLLSSHRGEESRLLATLDMTSRRREDWSSEPEFFERASGELWLVCGNRLFRITTAGEAVLVHRFSEVDLNRPFPKPKDLTAEIELPQPDSSEGRVGNIQLLEDSRERLWAWGFGDRKETRLLRDPWLFENGEWKSAPKIDGLPEAGLEGLTSIAKDRYWAPVVGGGLSEIDLAALRATPVAEPEAGAFAMVLDIQKQDEAIFVTTGTEKRENPGQAFWPVGSGALWRWQGSVWRKLATGLDDDWPLAQRAWLPSAHGTFFARSGGGLFWLPPGKDEPVLLDWRQGLGFNVRAIFELPGSRLLLVPIPTGGLSPTRPQVRELPIHLRPAPTHLESIRPWVRMVQAADGSLWYVAAANRDFLRGNRGDGWKDAPFPKGLAAAQVGQLATDARNRVWVMPDAASEVTGIYDPAADRWEVFASLEAAVLAHAREGPSLDVRAGWQSPVFSRDGRIAFSHPSDRLHYFDGKTWKRWDRLVVYEHPSFGRASIYPFFNKAARLAWNNRTYAGDRTQELSDSGEWQDANSEVNPADPSWKPDKLPALARGCITAKPDAIVADRFGDVWLTWQRQLYRALPGLCVPLFEKEQANPFDDGRGLGAVLIGNDGDAYVLTDPWGRGEYFRLLFSTPPPRAAVRAELVDADSVRLHLSATEAEAKWFRWRLDGGPWSDPAPETKVTHEALSNGVHRFEVLALDRWLRAAQPAAQATVTIASGDQIGRLIAQLDDPDFTRREAAVRLLAREADKSLPRLRSAFETRNKSDRFWIAAALNEIETQRKNATRAATPAAREP